MLGFGIAYPLQLDVIFGVFLSRWIFRWTLNRSRSDGFTLKVSMLTNINFE